MNIAAITVVVTIASLFWIFIFILCLFHQHSAEVNCFPSMRLRVKAVSNLSPDQQSMVE